MNKKNVKSTNKTTKNTQTSVVFLDCDGVLNTTKILSRNFESHDSNVIFYPEDLEATPLSKECLSNLKVLLDKTNSKIVLTTYWRVDEDNKKMLLYYLKEMGMGSEYILGQTKDLATMHSDDRGLEVKEYLKEHPDVKRYVIVDDQNENHFLKHGYQQYFVHCNVDNGLTADDVKKGIEILKNDQLFKGI
eukprot:Mrub_05329.p1 GENE.Mrub_05329~~Mrub_05329.p1  ORF type:complete len:190 (+),score=50.04 Mrub_05329:246-815(+)